MSRSQAAIRHAVAVDAARLLYRREFKEYYQAKREAAKRQGVKVLPTNQEIHRQLLTIAEAKEGPARTARLTSMREVALEVMEVLSDFSPRLIGSVLTGHIREGSDIDLHLYSDTPERVYQVLERALLHFQLRRVRSRKQGREQEFLHLNHLHRSGYELEMTLHPWEARLQHPLCSITGGPMARASLAELRQICRDSTCEPDLTPPTLQAEASLLEAPVNWALVEEGVPELGACRGVPQNHFHHLDVYQHTVAVVEGLQLLLKSDFVPFEKWREHLRQHLQEGIQGWSRSSLLLWAGLCHDLGKPHTLSLHPSGRYRFLGHDSQGGRLVEEIGERLSFPDPVSEALKRLVEHHMIAVLLPSSAPTASELHGFFRKTGDLAPELLLLSWADTLAARGPASTLERREEQRFFVEEMLGEFFERSLLRFPNCPVSEVDLSLELGLDDPILLAKLLERLTEEFLDGEFRGREDGLSRASELLEMSWKLW